jgi:hypothetical protein
MNKKVKHRRMGWAGSLITVRSKIPSTFEFSFFKRLVSVGLSSKRFRDTIVIARFDQIR